MKKIKFFSFFSFLFFVNILQSQNDIDSTMLYFEKKNFHKTISFCIKKNDYYSLNNLAYVLLDNKDYANSLLFSLKAMEIGKFYFDDKNYISLLELIGFNYQNLMDYNNAVLYFEEAFNLNSKLYGEHDDSNINYLINLIVNYKLMNDFKKSIYFANKEIKLVESKYGISERKYLVHLNNLADMYATDGQLEQAEILFKKIVDIRKITIGEKHQDYVLSISNLASIYTEEGKYSLADPLFKQALELSKIINGDKHPQYALCLNNLASCYQRQDMFAKAEPLLKQALEITKIIYGDKHPEYASYLNNLAVLYSGKGMYAKAEPLQKQALEIKKIIYGDKHPECALYLNNLAVLYVHQGMYAKAEPIQKQALEIRKIILGNKHPDYASSLQNLAAIYVNQNKYSDAETLYKEALAINEDLLSVNHPDYALSLDLLAQLYRDQEKYSDAEPLFLKALEIRKEILGEKNSDYALTMNNLALLYELQDKHSKAEPLFLKALEIRKEILGENHPDYISSLFFVANFYRIIESNDKAVNYYEQFLNSNHNRMLEDIYSLSEKDLINYIDVNKTLLFSPLSFLNNFPTIYPVINNNCFENELLVKNLSLRNNQLVQRKIQKTGNKLLKEKYEKFITNKIKIGKLNEIVINNRKSDSETLISENEILEKDLIKESATFYEYKKLMSFKWTDFIVKLKSDETTIDLVSFKHHKTNILYAAFVVKKDSKYPKFIPLFEEKQLALLLGKDKNQQDSKRIDEQYLNKQLSELILKPLENELKGISTIYLSLSGLTHQINVAALPINENQTFGQKYKIHILNSPSELIDYTAITFDKKDKLDFILYGNIDYDKRNIIPNKDSLDNQDFVNVDEEIKDLQTRSGISNFGYLSGTKNEIENISTLANKSNLKTIIFEDRNATEESIKQLDGRTTPFILHLATHGFFFPDPVIEMSNEFLIEGKSKVFKTSDDPMMRSGLVFSGANKSWGKTNENQTGDDGILTASEISNLDLSACKLVVLSACETGLGEVKGSEGVFGLQRAFKMAGVKNIIMSLWKVPDAQTAELFDTFYSECFAGKTIHEAFHSAQAKMKAKYSPYYWAGFVLLE